MEASAYWQVGRMLYLLRALLGKETRDGIWRGVSVQGLACGRTTALGGMVRGRPW